MGLEFIGYIGNHNASETIIGRDGHIHFADVSPDWLKRTETTEILAALPEPEVV